MPERPNAPPQILVVEDELIVSADLSARLKRMGYRVAGQVDTAESAIEFCAAAKPDLVLMDIRLKGAVDGITAADTVLKDFQIPVVFLTAHADEATLQRAKATEPFGYVLKPFEERELRIVIEMSLNRANLQRELYRSRSELAAILGSIGDAVIAVDVMDYVSYLNPVAERMTCFNQVDAIRLPFSRIATCYNVVDGKPLSVEQLAGSSVLQSARHELRLRTSFGTEYTVIANVTALRSVEGTLSGRVLVFRDITQQRRLEEELKQSQRMEALGQLAVGIAHDLNNILTVICVNHSLLVETFPEDSAESELLDGIAQATDRATRMTQQLLAIGKNQMVQPRILDLDSVIEESMSLLERLLTSKTRCVYQPCNRPLPILADQNQIEQILLNLLINARNSMPDGGTITLRTSYIENCKELEPQRKQLPSTMPLDSATLPAVLLEVEDTGCGIDAETTNRIWEPFFSSNDKGTGLGLAVVYGAVKQAGGQVSLASTVGKGSTFRVYLPLVETE